MKNRTRFLNTLNFKEVDDRLPMIEWADWWDKTISRWRLEGLPLDLPTNEIREYLGLDKLKQFWLSPIKDNYPQVKDGQGIVLDEESYNRAKEYIFPQDKIKKLKEELYLLKPLHDSNEVVIWVTLEGFFWFPRKLLGIKNHLLTFYDNPDLMHKINSELLEYNLAIMNKFCEIVKPDFMTFAEDMSYNKGPMLSHGLFKDFLLPYYKKIIPILKKNEILVFVDTDGNVEYMIPWLQEAGVDGILPLERQAGVDVSRIRKNFPNFRMIGGFNKMVMSRKEKDIRNEFERLLPVMKSGGFIAACDHQTPPEVSFKNYKIYLELLKEYCEKAAR